MKSGFTLGDRGVVSAAMAIPLMLMMVGSGLGLWFEETVAFNRLGLWYWVSIAYGLVEMGLALGIFIPYLHRLCAAVLAVDMLWQAALNANFGRNGWAFMYAICFVMAAAIAVLWKTRDFEAEATEKHAMAHAA